jgi:hypothetical protein
MVVIFLFCAIIARVKQDKTRAPSTCTVHAPHAPWSQPFLVPMSPNRSRKASSRVVRESIATFDTLPFTFSVHSEGPPRTCSGSASSLCFTLSAEVRSSGTATDNPAEIAAKRPIKSRRDETADPGELEEVIVEGSGFCSISNDRRSLRPVLEAMTKTDRT